VTDFLQFSYQGLVLGSIYALIALGFVIIYKTSEVVNFAQGELVLLGAYFVLLWRNDVGLPFALAVPIAMLMMMVIGLVVERVVLRPMVGKPIFSVVMITIGLAIVIHQLVTSVWGFSPRNIDDPWGTKQVEIGGVLLSHVSIATLIATVILMAAFFWFFKYTKFGIAMRAAAFDPEAALSLGIGVRRMTATAWVIAGLTATVAGVLLSGFPRGLNPNLSFVALRAFPAIIVGGLDSTGGAVVGGLMIGWIELMVQGYGGDVAPWLGENFHVIAAYAVMVVVLMIRPYGLFGTKEVERV